MELIELESFYSPSTPDDAAQFLKGNDGSKMVLGGGTFVHGLVARGLLTHITHLVDLTNLPLSWVKSDNKYISFGATTTLQTISDELPASDSPWLDGVADAMKYPPAQIRNSATLGGNVAAGCPFFDLPIVLISLNATAFVSGNSGKREIPISELYVSLFQTSLTSDEFVSEVRIPRPSHRVASSYEKLETNSNDLAIVSIGVSLSLGADGRVNQVAIVAGGGVGEVPIRCIESEKKLIGKKPEAATIEECAEAAKQEVEPINDHRASAAYRKQMFKVLTARNIERALARLAQGDKK
jgi:CO/xanthine dehydrogenase FAD-binding subunit